MAVSTRSFRGIQWWDLAHKGEPFQAGTPNDVEFLGYSPRGTLLLAIDKEADIANCSVTKYEHDESLGPRGNLRLKLFNFVAPLEEAGAPVTSEPDVKVGAS